MPKCRQCGVEADTARCPECEAIMKVRCPKCAVDARLREGFRCGACGREELCMGHLDREANTCSECEIAAQPGAPIGFQLLKRNTFGFREYRCQRDRSRMVLIPAGQFFYGDEKQPLYLPTFLLDLWPVTNEQYKRFVKETGHAAPDEWGDPQFSKPRQPVCGVSWDDASAYADWIGKRLPSEEEWEKAARGHDGRIYPWGDEEPSDEVANYDHQIGRTSSIGRFPEGRSPYGCVEMAGNVLEWCASWFDIERRSRVLRGGAFVSGPKTIRSAFRFGDATDASYPIFGFRCARDWGGK